MLTLEVGSRGNEQLGWIARSKAMLVYLAVGALLAQRYKVFVLVPAIALTAALAVVIGIRQGETSWQILGFAVLDVTALQIGYLVGTGIQFLATSSHAISARRGSIRAWMSRHAAN